MSFGSVGSFEISGDGLSLAFVGGALRFKAGGRLVPSEPETSEVEGASDDGDADGTEVEARRST